MKKVFIKYNPYNLTTEFTVDGKELAENSKIREAIKPDARLQEWVEDLPKNLIEEYNDNDFDIMFHGTKQDFEDIVEVFTEAFNRDELTAEIDIIEAEETTDKEAQIDEIFAEIQNGPFEELKDGAINDAFKQAKSKDFDVCVVATMSAGKSTLINSMLGTKLMPSKAEACTAIITKIKDIDGTKNWQADVYDREGRWIEGHENLDCDTMVALNENENVSEINIVGDILFVPSDEISLVLIDTPGPNNARNKDHHKVQSEFLNKSSKALVLYIMESTFGSDDDNSLLDRVARSMKAGGKQSKDRYIFVVNKMDNRNKEDGDIEQTLGKIREYLESHEIMNPNLYPVSALPALNIRLIQNGVDVDEDTLDETEMKVKKLNRSLHLEEYASLPTSIKNEIKAELETAKKNNDAQTEALIHTGVTSVEAAIRQYVEKYAKTAKIKNIVDSFMHKLDEVDCFEKTKNELAKNIEEGNKIAGNIEKIRKKIDDVNTAKHFKDAVDDAIVKVNDEAADLIGDVVGTYQVELSNKIVSGRGDELDLNEAEKEAERLGKFAKRLEPSFHADLDELIKNSLNSTKEVLLSEYRKKIDDLKNEIDSSGLEGLKIDPLKLMEGSVTGIGASPSVNDFAKTKEVEDGEEWVTNTDKKWYKPWTWSQPKGWYVTKYKTVKYVDASELAQAYLAPIQENIYQNGDEAKTHALKQANRIAGAYEKEFKKLDTVLKDKLTELESYATDKEKADERVKETESRLQWLEDIKGRVDNILKI